MDAAAIRIALMPCSTTFRALKLGVRLPQCPERGEKRNQYHCNRHDHVASRIQDTIALCGPQDRLRDLRCHDLPGFPEPCAYIGEISTCVAREFFGHCAGCDGIVEASGGTANFSKNEPARRSFLDRRLGDHPRNDAVNVKWLREQPDNEEQEGRDNHLHCNICPVIGRQGMQSRKLSPGAGHGPRPPQNVPHHSDG